VKAQVPVIFHLKNWMSILFNDINDNNGNKKPSTPAQVGLLFRTVTYLHVQDKFGDYAHNFLFFPRSA